MLKKITIKNIGVNIASWLYYLIPISLLTGSFLPDLFLSLIAFIFLFLSIKFKYYHYFKNKFFVIFFSFYIYLIFNSLISEHQLHSLESTLFYFRFGLFALATWFLIEEKENFFQTFYFILLITIIIALIDGIYQQIYNIGLFGIYNEIPNRLALTFNDKLILGGYLARMLPILIAVMLISEKNIRNKYALIALLFIITDVIVYVSGERTALGLMAVLTILLILLMSKFQYLRLFTLIVSIALIIGISVYNPSSRERVVDLTFEQMGLENDINNDEYDFRYFTPIHDSLYRTSFKMFLDKPVFGHGPNTFRKLCSEDRYNVGRYGCSTHPHNFYLQLLAETGIIGIVPLLVVIIYLINTIFKQLFSIIKREKYKFCSDFQVCIIAALVLSLFPFLPTQNFFNNWINVIIYLPVGFYLYSLYSHKFSRDK